MKLQTRHAAFSDIRLKTDIIFDSIMDNINVYTFKYIWDKLTTYRGVMAQELIGTKYESAVIKDASGWYKVDYSKLPVKCIFLGVTK